MLCEATARMLWLRSELPLDQAVHNERVSHKLHAQQQPI